MDVGDKVGAFEVGALVGFVVVGDREVGALVAAFVVGDREVGAFVGALEVGAFVGDLLGPFVVGDKEVGVTEGVKVGANTYLRSVVITPANSAAKKTATTKEKEPKITNDLDTIFFIDR